MLQPSDYFALVSRQPNRLKIVNAHDEVVQVITDCLPENVSFYYKSKATCGFKFSSQPFAIGGSQDQTILIKRMLADIIERLQSINWHVVINSDMAREKTSFCLFFRKIVAFNQVMKNKLSRDGKIFTFSPSGLSSLLLIDIPYFLEKEMIDVIKSQCSVNDYKMLQNVESSIRLCQLMTLTTELDNHIFSDILSWKIPKEGQIPLSSKYALIWQ